MGSLSLDRVTADSTRAQGSLSGPGWAAHSRSLRRSRREEGEAYAASWEAPGKLVGEQMTIQISIRTP